MRTAWLMLLILWSVTVVAVAMLVMGCGPDYVPFLIDASRPDTAMPRDMEMERCDSDMDIPFLCFSSSDLSSEECSVDSECGTPYRCITKPPLAPVIEGSDLVACEDGGCCHRLVTTDGDDSKVSWKNCGDGWKCESIRRSR